MSKKAHVGRGPGVRTRGNPDPHSRQYAARHSGTSDNTRSNVKHSNR